MNFGLSGMSEKQAAKWKKTRAKGRRHFIIYSGVLGWGLIMFVFMTAFIHLQQANFDIQQLSGLSLVVVLVNLLVWTLGGLVFGVLTWHGNEKLYQKTIPPRQTD